MAEKATIFLLVTILVLLTLIVIFGMKYLAGVRQARLRIAGEDAYRELAARAVKAGEESATALAALQKDVARIEARVARIEKVLEEVG